MKGLNTEEVIKGYALIRELAHITIIQALDMEGIVFQRIRNNYWQIMIMCLKI